MRHTLGALLVGTALLASAGGVSAQSFGTTSAGGPVPQPAAALPPAEVVGGQVGTSLEYMRADARLPRITRAQQVTTLSDGTFTGTWTNPTAANPMLILTPISAGTAAVTCQLTSAPTTTAFAGKCWVAQQVALTLGNVTAGLNVIPLIPTGSGIAVQVIAIPPAQ